MSAMRRHAIYKGRYRQLKKENPFSRSNRSIKRFIKFTPNVFSNLKNK